MKRYCLGSMLFVAVVTIASRPASARDALPIINWTSASPSCPRPDDLLARIGKLIGVPASKLPGRLLRLDAEVGQAAARSGAWQMRLNVETAAGGGERQFSADSCQQLVDAAVLIVALAIDPSAVKAKQRPPGKKTPAAVGGGKRALQLALRPQVGVSFGVLPSASVGFGLAAALLWRSLRVELAAAHQLGQQQPAAAAVAVPAAADLQLRLRGELRGCYRLPLGGRFDIDLCGGSELGWLHGAGRNIATPESGDALWFSLATSVGLSYRLWRRLWARADGTAGLTPIRPRFEIEGIGQLHRPSLATARFGFGAEMRFF